MKIIFLFEGEIVRSKVSRNEQNNTFYWAKKHINETLFTKITPCEVNGYIVLKLTLTVTDYLLFL